MSTVYRGDMATQGEAPFYVPQSNGCEVLSNDRELKLVLSRTISFMTEVEQEFYSVKYYVKVDDGWELTNTAKSYQSADDFMRELDGTEEFTNAVREWENKDDMNG